MNDYRLTMLQVVLLCVYAAGMAGGQLLFKMAANSLSVTGNVSDRLIELAGNRYFFSAFVVYCVLALMWVWILTFTPLSRAYPFVALAFAITPLLGAGLFNEPITVRLGLGIAAMIGGLFLVIG